MVESGSGTNVSLIIGAGLEVERFIAKVSVNPYVYDMSLWLVDRLSKPLSDFTIKKQFSFHQVFEEI